MKLTPNQLDYLAKQDWNYGPDFSAVVENKTFKGSEDLPLKVKHIKLQTESGDLLVIRDNKG